MESIGVLLVTAALAQGVVPSASNPDATGFSARTRRPSALSSAISWRVTNVLPMPVPDDVMKSVVIPRAMGARPQRARRERL